MGAILAIGCTSLAPFAGGCGNDDAPIEPVTDEATSTSASTLSQDEFIVSADSRCAEANAAIANLTSGTEPSLGAVGQELEITRGVLEGLQGIGEAEDPDGSLAEFFTALEEEVSILEEQEAAVSSGNAEGADLLDADLDAARTDAEAAASTYGLEECGGQGSALPGTEPGVTTPAAPVAPADPTTTTPVPVEPVPVEPAPVEPAEPAPVTPPPPSGGAGGGTGTPAPDDGGSSGGSSGGISPG